MTQQHTPGPWMVVPPDRDRPSRATVCGGGVDIYDAPLTRETAANARLIAAAPDRHDQILALVAYNWQLEKRSLYDEEGVEGWVWIEPNGREHTGIGSWGELPPWPESARAALAAAKGGAKCEKASVSRTMLFNAAQIIEQAVARVEIANTEGDPILSAWLGDAKRFLESVVNDPRLV